MTLLRFLRDRMNLMGSKDGCSTGHCGACMVILGGKATRACLVKMAKIDQTRVETIEGLAKDGNLHPIQQAFVEKGAVQCGFCTPGMIMTAKALLDANPHPALGEIKKVLTQNTTCAAARAISRSLKPSTGGRVDGGWSKPGVPRRPNGGET
jgi:carbon-monoxide dehydrogenase small subunit